MRLRRPALRRCPVASVLAPAHRRACEPYGWRWPAGSRSTAATLSSAARARSATVCPIGPSRSRSRRRRSPLQIGRGRMTRRLGWRTIQGSRSGTRAEYRFAPGCRAQSRRTGPHRTPATAYQGHNEFVNLRDARMSKSRGGTAAGAPRRRLPRSGLARTGPRDHRRPRGGRRRRAAGDHHLRPARPAARHLGLQHLRRLPLPPCRCRPGTRLSNQRLRRRSHHPHALNCPRRQTLTFKPP